MKKGFAILLLLVYSISALSITLKEQSCCGKQKTIAVDACQHKSKPCNKSKEQNDCCKFKVAYIKIADSYLASNLTPAAEKFSIYPCTISALWQPFHYNITLSKEIAGSPPLKHNQVPIHIFDCVYRI